MAKKDLKAMTGKDPRWELWVKLVLETIAELDGIMDVTLSQWAKDVVKRTLGRSARTKDPMFWPAGMLMLGLVEARRSIIENYAGDEDAQLIVVGIDAAILKHINMWKHKHGAKVDFIDDALAGAALCRLYRQSYDEALRTSCKSACEKIYEYLCAAARDKEGTIVYNAERSVANVFADGVGQTAMFLCAYSSAFRDEKALELARQQLLNYKNFGMDDKSGLPYHGYAHLMEGCEKKGVLSWGRAAGWLVMGLSEYARLLDEKGALEDELVKWYEALCRTLMTYQRKDGGFSWQVQAVEGHLDISATGMIIYGILNGGGDYKTGILSEDVNLAIEVIRSSITEGKVQNALSSCDDFAVHYQTYGHYPWGQGAALMAVSRTM